MKTVRSGRVFLGSMGFLALVSLMGLGGCAGTTGTQQTATSATSSAKGGNLFNPPALVAAHNKWRTEVGSPKLHWSDNLAESSQEWANSLKRTCMIRHSHNQPYGENVFYASPVSKMSSYGGLETSPQEISSEKMVDAWGEEKQWYDYTSNSCHGGECGHYTQVVWKDTSEVGCGMAYCKDDAQIWVCQYQEAGNQRGKKPY